MSQITLGNKEIEKGVKKHVVFKIQDDPAGNVDLLVGVINGIEKGPVVSITGGLYSTIYPGVDACIRLFNELDPIKLKGTVLVVPVVEITGFQKVMDKSPIDGLNPNTLFPGDPNGTISHRIAHTLFNEIILRSEYHLDLRGGDLWENLHTFSISSDLGDLDFDKKTEKLAKLLGPKYYLKIPNMKGSLIGEACKKGVYSIILEAAKGLATYEEEDIDINLKGIYNLLKSLKMVEGAVDVSDQPKTEEFKMYQIKAKVGGLLYLNNKYGEFASKGEKLGEIKNLKGEVLQELISPIDGIVHCTFPKHVKQPGDLIIGMRKIIE
jgi:predicted deacylase